MSDSQTARARKIAENAYSLSNNDVIINFHIVKIHFRPISKIKLDIFLPASQELLSISIKQPFRGGFMRHMLRSDLENVPR